MAEPFYQDFTTTRTTEPHLPTLIVQLKALDASAGVQHAVGSNVYRLKKATAWTAPQTTSAQNVIDTAPASSPQLTAQNEIDNWPISQRAFAYALLDVINLLRTQPTTAFAAITPAQVLQAIRDKAATL